jgi:hypothetical protein
MKVGSSPQQLFVLSHQIRQHLSDQTTQRLKQVTANAVVGYRHSLEMHDDSLRIQDIRGVVVEQKPLFGMQSLVNKVNKFLLRKNYRRTSEDTSPSTLSMPKRITTEETEFSYRYGKFLHVSTASDAGDTE